MANPYGGRGFERGGDGYEQARRAAVWKARTPERYPQLIVLAESESDVIGAVREAVAVLQSCPVLDRAKLALPYVPGEGRGVA
jgi:hypothetical protein